MSLQDLLSHHPGARRVDIVLHVTQAVIWRDDSCQAAVQGQVGRLVGHQEQQTFGFWPPTHLSLTERQRRLKMSSKCYVYW